MRVHFRLASTISLLLCLFGVHAEDYPVDTPSITISANGKLHHPEGMDAVHLTMWAIDLLKSCSINMASIKETKLNSDRPFLAGDHIDITFQKPFSLKILADNEPVNAKRLSLILHNDVRNNMRARIFVQSNNVKTEYTKYHAHHMIKAIILYMAELKRP